MNDPTESMRRDLVGAINSSPQPRELLEKVYGLDGVWDTSELGEKFEVIGFLAPFCVVRRRSDGKKGSVMFQHFPRFYFDFTIYE